MKQSRTAKHRLNNIYTGPWNDRETALLKSVVQKYVNHELLVAEEIAPFYNQEAKQNKGIGRARSAGAISFKLDLWMAEELEEWLVESFGNHWQKHLTTARLALRQQGKKQVKADKNPVKEVDFNSFVVDPVVKTRVPKEIYDEWYQMKKKELEQMYGQLIKSV